MLLRMRNAVINTKDLFESFSVAINTQVLIWQTLMLNEEMAPLIDEALLD